MSIHVRPRHHFKHPDFAIAFLGLLVFCFGIIAGGILVERYPTQGWGCIAAGMVAWWQTDNRLRAWQSEVDEW